MTKHTLSVLVENKPGVLARVAGLFSRRGFNIESLAVGPTEHADVSRMTIVVAVYQLPLEQVTKQLNKLVNVIKIVELYPAQSVQRELLLVKVRADVTVRSQVLETVQLFRAKVVDVAPESLTIEATGTVDKISVIQGAIRGMIDSLGDPYSAYLSAEDYRKSLQGISGQFEGIGAEITSAPPRTPGSRSMASRNC